MGAVKDPPRQDDLGSESGGGQAGQAQQGSNPAGANTHEFALPPEATGGQNPSAAAPQAAPVGSPSETPNTAYDTSGAADSSPYGDSSDPRGDDNPDGEESVGKDGLNKAESAGDPDFNGDSKKDKNEDSDDEDDEEEASPRRRGSAADSDPSLFRKVAQPLALRAIFKNKKAQGILGAGGGTAAVVFFTLFFGGTLKIENMVQNLRDSFYASPQAALVDVSQKIMSAYFVSYVLPSYKNCKSVTTRDSSCKVSVVGGNSNPVANLYRSYADARIETKFAEKYGIEMRYSVHSNTWRMKVPGVDGDGVDIGRNGEKMEQVLKNRQDVRRAFEDAIDGETKFKKVYLRFQFGAVLESKYGIKRCIVNCVGDLSAHKYTDMFYDKIDEKKLAGKIFLNERVLQPRNELSAIAIRCILDTNCHPETTSTGNTDDPDNGEPRSDVEREATSTLQQLASQYSRGSPADVEEITKRYNAMAEKGFQTYAIEQAMVKVFGAEAGQVAAQRISVAIPVIGWIHLGATVVETAADSGPKVKKLAYMVAAGAAIAEYQKSATYADEIHTGAVDATEVGSFNSTFGVTTDPIPEGMEIAGGNTDATETPLYKSVMQTGGTSTTTALLDTVLPAKASAATSENGGNTCKNGKGVPAGQLVCQEQLLGQGLGITNAMTELFKQPQFSGILVLAKVWNGTIGALINGVANAVGGIIGDAIQASTSVLNKSCDLTKGLTPREYCNIKDSIDVIAPKLMEALNFNLLPSAFGDITGGGRIFDINAAGAAASGKDMVANLGGKRVSPSVMADIVNEQRAEKQHKFESKPMFARMFDTSDNYSLVSRVAVSMPSKPLVSSQAGFANIISNPIGVFGSVFGNMFASPSAYAATPDSVDPFHIGTDAFPESDIPENPVGYWEEKNCGDTSENGPIAQWQEEAAKGPVDENTGMPVHRTTQPCLLIKQGIGAMGAVFDTDFLSPSEQKILEGAKVAAAAKPEAATGDAPSGSAKELAKELVPLVSSGKVKCLTSGCPDIKDTAAGKSIKRGGCKVESLDPALLGMLLKLTQMNHTFILSALCSDHSAGSITGHSGGRAADFNTIDGVFMGPSATGYWTGAKLKAGKKLDQDVASFMPKTAGERVGFGQINCHENFPFFSGFETFSDTCHHQHIEVKQP